MKIYIPERVYLMSSEKCVEKEKYAMYICLSILIMVKYEQAVSTGNRSTGVRDHAFAS